MQKNIRSRLFNFLTSIRYNFINNNDPRGNFPNYEFRLKQNIRRRRAGAWRTELRSCACNSPDVRVSLPLFSVFRCVCHTFILGIGRRGACCVSLVYPIGRLRGVSECIIFFVLHVKALHKVRTSTRFIIERKFHF